MLDKWKKKIRKLGFLGLEENKNDKGLNQQNSRDCDSKHFYKTAVQSKNISNISRKALK